MKRNTLIIIALAVVFVGSFGAYFAHLQRSIDSIAVQNRANVEARHKFDRREVAGLPVIATCGACDGKVSSSADRCPHCGDPRRPK